VVPGTPGSAEEAAINHSRYRFAFLISAAIALSYIDRQTLPVAIRAVQASIPISNTEFSSLQAAFLIAYALAYLAGGRLVDRAGARTGFLLMMGWWSVACAGQALASGFWSLAVARLLLGLGEGGGFPAAARAVSEWFPVKERSAAMGIIHSGSSAGAVIAPPLVAAVLSAAGWRWSFVVPGVLGLVWTAWWWRNCTPEESGQTERAEPQCSQEDSVPGWLELARLREVQGLFAAKFLYDSAFYFYLFWLPKYLYDARGFDTKAVGYFAWIPYAAHGLGGLAAGWISSRLIARGHSLDFARKAVLGVSAAVMPVVFGVTKAPVEVAIVLLSIAYFGQAATSTMVMVLPVDLFPKSAVGSVSGLIGFGGALGGIVFGFVVGFLLDHGAGYGPVFALVSSFHAVAFAVVLLTVREVRPVVWRKAAQRA